MVLPPSSSRKMGEIETVEAEKMGWLALPRGTSYPTFPYGFSRAEYVVGDGNDQINWSCQGRWSEASKLSVVFAVKNSVTIQNICTTRKKAKLSLS